MSFSINTNVTSLQAQNYLNKSAAFQAQTINEVTSGLRIVNSGDDAAGLAIANGLRSSQAVLTQGIRNANDGLSTLQTIDGGINNISNLLDRAATLATQSASSTFTGDRGVLNSEFQSVLTEVNRQSQAIGLNTGGTFAKSLSVFIGGGAAGGATNAIQNGSVSVDLTHSTVDTQSLGLSGFSATGNSAVDIGTGAGATSVQSIIADTTNQGTQAQTGFTTLNFTGPGFTSTNGSNRVSISVNLSGVTDAASLATAVNAAIQTAGNGTTQQATAFKNAGIQASIHQDSSGASHLQFTSSSSAFQVEAGDSTANALLGNIAIGGTGSTGVSVGVSTATTNVTALAAATATETVSLKIANGAGTNGAPTTVSVNITNLDSAATTLTNIQTALKGSGVSAALSGGKLQFTDGQGTTLAVQASGDNQNTLGLGTFTTAATSFTAGAAPAAAATQNIQVSIGNQVADLGSLSTGADENAALGALNTAFQGNALTAAAGLTAVDNAGSIKIESSNGTSFRLNSYGASDGGHVGFGFGTGAANSDAAGVDSHLVGTLAASAATVVTGSVGSPSLDSNGVSSSGFLNFNGIALGNASQTVALTAPDSTGSAHSISFSLSAADSGDIDTAINTINTKLLQSNDSTLQTIVAVKDQQNGSDGIRFVSSLQHFSVSLGTTAAGTGTPSLIQGLSNGTAPGSQGGAVIASTQLGSGTTADISSQTNAENAVTAITDAVKALGVSQAAVGKGENNFNYAVNLAQSQVTNEAAAESRIRDADLAAEAANLSKAQILVQAGTAALAQANSAPQAVLSLLRG